MKPSKIGPLLTSELRRLGLSTRLRSGMAPGLWPRVVGPEIAAQTEAGQVRDRLLMIKTPNPVLAHQIGLMQHEIMRRYRKILGGPVLRGIRVQIGQIASADRPVEPSRSRPAALSAEQEEKLAILARNIPDPALSAVFLRVARKGMLQKNAGAGDSIQAYLELVAGDSWPTPLELQAALDRLDPDCREEAKNQAIELLRRKILAGVAGRTRDTSSNLALRGDIRRLALITGRTPANLGSADLDQLLVSMMEREEN